MARRLAELDLAGRINALVERHFGGNVLQAARAWGVPQPTAHRLVTGTTNRPHVATLHRIARYHQTTVRWLRDGNEEEPNPLETPPLPGVEYLEFQKVVDRLGLDPETRWAVLSLPTTIGAAHAVMCRWGAGYAPDWQEQPPRVVQESQHAAWKAAALQYLSWAYLLEGMMRAYGVKRVRDKLKTEITRVQLGFHPIAMELLNIEGGEETFRGQVLPRTQTGGPHAGTTLLNLPSTPPLDVIPPEHLRPGRGRPRLSRPYKRYDEERDGTD